FIRRKIMDALDKELPNAPDAERAILGNLILDPSRINEVIPKLSPDDFYNRTHENILSAMLELHQAGKDVNQVLIVEHLRSKGIMSISVTDITKLLQGVFNDKRLDPYIDLVKEKAARRRCIKIVNDIIARIMDGEETLEETANRDRTSFDDLAEQITAASTPVIMSY